MTDADFLAAIAARPSDDLTRLVYADWLDEQGDPRAEYVRLAVAVAANSTSTERTPRLHELAAAFDAEWRMGVGVRYDVLLAALPRAYVINAVKAVRAATGLGLSEIAGIINSADRLILPAALREDAEGCVGEFFADLVKSAPDARDQFRLAFRRSA